MGNGKQSSCVIMIKMETFIEIKNKINCENANKECRK